MPRTRGVHAARGAACHFYPCVCYRPTAGGFSNTDSSRQKTTKTARPAVTIIVTLLPSGDSLSNRMAALFLDDYDLRRSGRLGLFLGRRGVRRWRWFTWVQPHM